MPFSVWCDNKGCMKYQSPALDTDTNQVLCTECDREIKSITDFAKRQMKGLNQIVKKKAQSSFAVKCQKCNKQGTPVLIDDEFCCGACQSVLNLSAPFVLMLKRNLKT